MTQAALSPAMNELTPSTPTTVSDRLARNAARNVKERAIEAILFGAALVSVLTTVGIVWVLVSESLKFFDDVPLSVFLTDTMWTPLFSEPRYGILPLLTGTVTTSLVALAVAIPLGTIIAAYLSEFASSRVREVVKPFLELLGGIPTIVYGYFALTVVTPLLQSVWPELPGFSMLSAGLVMGIAIVPYISSLAEDAMRAVPMSLREGAYGMGSTRFQTAMRVVFPAALSGVLSAYILGISRAVGETMIVAVAAGMQPNFTMDPTEPAQTISAYIVQVAMGDLPHGSVGYQSIFAAGLSLMLMTLLFNILGHVIRRRYREAY
ncbi:phosphate ABC transporter permease subunit PstC [Zoogloea sp.]|uniref:phosphate ABC transporter permease subunit PstC n=1 Tax=Zoogloea sp. TaxID=49181 RepID=UPI0035B0FEDB|nr:phosphate ABC transporter permease subunit PstC [Rhodocyclales bacterium]